MTKSAVLIAGPTASGKSGLAVRLAEAVHGTVINADSMQLYRDLDVVTACPADAEMTRAPHRLYRMVDGTEAFSVARWHAAAAEAMAESWEAGRLPVLVGGTGLYFKTVLEGLSAVPEVPVEIRQQVRAWLEAEGAPALHARLEREDPKTAATLKPNDRQRTARALEVVLATGRPLLDWHEEATPGVLAGLDRAGRVGKFVLDLPRDELYARIDRRFAGMIEAGALEEIQAMAARGLDPELPVMKALGAPSLLAHLAGECSLEDAIQDAQMQSRRYAKRQMTWFRNQFADWNWIDAQDSESSYSRILSKILENRLTEQN